MQITKKKRTKNEKENIEMHPFVHNEYDINIEMVSKGCAVDGVIN